MGSRLFREQEIAGSTPAAPTGVSSNGRAAVLQTADGGSIPSTPTDAAAVCIFPRSKVVSRPLKPVTLVRFQLGEHMVAVVYWSARLAVNEEVRVRSPPVTPQATTGCGSMAGHLARNQVHAGSIPAAQTGDVVQREDAAFASLK
jgi:hypothetical protein